MTALVRRGATLVFDVRVVPRAAANALVTRGGTLVVRVTAPPADGRANTAVIRAVARALDLAPSEVSIVRGLTARTKTRVVPARAEEARRRLVK